SPDGTKILTRSLDKTVRLWDAATARPLVTLAHQQRVDAAVFAAGGARVVTASRDGAARIWDAATGALLHTLDVHDADRVLVAAAGGVVAAAGGRTLSLWSLDGEPLAVFVHTHAVALPALGADGARVAVGGSDGTTSVYDVAARRLLFALPGRYGPA